MVLPEPVGPVTRTSPRCSSASACIDVGQPDLLEGGPAEAELPEDHRDRAALAEDVHAEPAHVGHGVGEVDLAALLEDGLAILRDDAVGDRLGLQRTQGVAVEAIEAVGQPQHRRRPDLDVQVGAVALDEFLQPRVELRNDR